jgi:c-di-GMP-binding flagellar brake protein YcgR
MAADEPQRKDRREDERYSILGALGGAVMVFLPMAITEIGRGGVQVETPFAFQIDSLHELRLALGDRPIVVKGRVTHCSIIDVDHELVKYRTGLEFVELPPRVAEAIESFVDAVKDGRRAST